MENKLSSSALQPNSKMQLGVPGLFWGYVYFVFGPLCLKLLFGSIPAFDLDIHDFSYLSMEFSLYIIGTFFVVFAAWLLMAHIAKPINIKDKALSRYLTICWVGVFWVYFIHATNTSASHWSEGSAGQFGTGGGFFFILLLNAINVLLLASPFVCIAKGGPKLRLTIIAQVSAINIIILLITGNRIFALGLIILYFSILSNRGRFVLLACFPFILFLSHLYAILRSTIQISIMNFDSIFSAIGSAVEYRLDTFSVVDLMSPAFESANVVVLSHMINTNQIPELGLFETIVFRPLRAILPLGDVNSVNSTSLYIGSHLGLDGVAINSTLLGESWLNGGIVVWVFIITTVFFCDLISIKLRFSPLARVVLFSAAFYAWRFEFMYYIIAFTIVSIFEVFAKLFINSQRNSRNISTAKPI